jgi:hypothetical protein
MGMNKAPSESSLAGWDVLTEVPSEAAGAHQTFLQERVHELEAEVERLKLALIQQSGTNGASTSAGTVASSAAETRNTAQDAAVTVLADDWLLTEDAAAVTETILEDDHAAVTIASSETEVCNSNSACSEMDVPPYFSIYRTRDLCGMAVSTIS